MKKVFVLVGSMTSDERHIKLGKVEDISDEDYEKLKELGNVRDYNEETDGEVEDDSDLESKVSGLKAERDDAIEAQKTAESKISGLKAERDEAVTAKETAESETVDERVVALEAQKTALLQVIEDLKGFVETGKDTQKTHYPADYKAYIAALEA